MTDVLNRQRQMSNATYAANQGYTKATRHCTWAANSCSICRLEDAETIDIDYVINGSAMHEYCQCSFTFSEQYDPHEPVLQKEQYQDVKKDLDPILPSDLDPAYEDIDPISSEDWETYWKEYNERKSGYDEGDIVIITDPLPEDQEPDKYSWSCCVYNYMQFN